MNAFFLYVPTVNAFFPLVYSDCERLFFFLFFWYVQTVNAFLLYVYTVNAFCVCYVQTVKAFCLVCSDCDRLFLVCSDCEGFFVVVGMFRL